MRRIIWRLAILLSVMLFAFACGGGGGEEDKTSTAAISDRPSESAPVQGQPQVPGREAIPEHREMGDPGPGIMLVPRFAIDQDATTLAVAVGEHFEFYVCAIHPKRDVASATFRLELPEGVEILGETKPYSQSLSLGTYDDNFIVTYPCQPGGELYPVMRYSCLVMPSFTGGEIMVEEGLPVERHPPFRGFVSCGDLPEMVPAAGGVAVLTLK